MGNVSTHRIHFSIVVHVERHAHPDNFASKVFVRRRVNRLERLVVDNVSMCRPTRLIVERVTRGVVKGRSVSMESVLNNAIPTRSSATGIVLIRPQIPTIVVGVSSYVSLVRRVSRASAR